PPGQPTPRPTTTPTTSNTRMTYDINNNHDHTQATHQPPNNQPQYSGDRHSGEAARVTPGRGRGQDRTHPTSRPGGTPTAATTTTEAHAINAADGQRDDPDPGQQSRPPNRTLLGNTPSTTTPATRRQRSDHPLTAPQPAPTLWRGTLRRSRKGDARAGGAT